MVLMNLDQAAWLRLVGIVMVANICLDNLWFTEEPSNMSIVTNEKRSVSIHEALKLGHAEGRHIVCICSSAILQKMSAQMNVHN